MLTSAMVKVLEDPRAFSSTLLLIAFDTYGMDAFEWEIESLKDALKQEAPNLPDVNVRKLEVATGLFISDLFWQDPISFGLSCRVLNRHRVIGADAPNVEDICWGVAESQILYGSQTEDDKDEDGPKFSEAVKMYIAQVLKSESVDISPQTLDFIPSIAGYTGIDDPAMLEARSAADRDEAAYYDSTVKTKIVELMRQIIDCGVDLNEEAQKEINKALSDVSNNNS